MSAIHADQSGVTAIFAEQYFQTPGEKPAAEAPGSDAGPFSAIDSVNRGLRRLVLGLRLRHRPVGHRHQLRRDPRQGGKRRRDHLPAGGQLPVRRGRLGGRQRGRLPGLAQGHAQVPGAHRCHHGRRTHLARPVGQRLVRAVSRRARLVSSGLRRAASRFLLLSVPRSPRPPACRPGANIVDRWCRDSDTSDPRSFCAPGPLGLSCCYHAVAMDGDLMPARPRLRRETALNMTVSRALSSGARRR